MVSSIQSLSNMEYQLYGRSGVGGYGMTNAPSVMNGYMMQSPYNTSFYYNYPYNSIYQAPAAGYTQPAQTTQQTTQQTTNENNNGQTAFQGLTQQDLNALANDYAASMAPSESFGSALGGAAAFSLLFHPRSIIHPINTIKSFKPTSAMFADVTKKGTQLAKGWANPATNSVLRDAYTAMNRIQARSFKKGGLHIWRAPLKDGEYEALKKTMEKALNGFRADNPKSVEELIKATETLNQANVKNGCLPKAWNWVKNIFRSDKKAIPSALEASKNTEVIGANVKNALNAGKGVSKSYLQTLKTSGGGIKGGIFFLGLEYLMSMGKIISSFNKDTKTGLTQLGQTTVKGLGNAVGWAAGEALGVWGTTKLLSMAGTAIAPGIGTAIGAVAGMIVGSIGCSLAGKVTKKLVGQDVGDKVEAENMAKSQEGQVQLLQNTITRIQNGENVSPQAQMAVQKALNLYA